MSPATPRVALTRREFLARTARFGTAAVLGSMFALDLLARDRGGFRLEPAAASRRRRIIVLGGGPAGLSSTYELRKAGHDCVLLEARPRPGGRIWTVRRGTRETEIGNPEQVCQFDAGLFYNAGPMRIAHHHESTLDYCREFQIPLVPFTNFNEAAFIHVDGHPRLRIREVDADLRGHVAELLAKVIRQRDLDLPLTKDDREKLIEYLRDEGRLDKTLLYPRRGDTSIDRTYFDHPRGYTLSAGSDDGPGAPTAPQELEALLQAGYASLHPYDHELNQQATMLTPSEGMDRIAYAFAERLGAAIRYGAEVRQIRRTATGVRIVYADATLGGREQEITGDFCICALPPYLAARLPSDFQPQTLRALRMGRAEHAGKIGLQFKRRFWEEDDDIYGGRSLTNLPISQIYYPFDGFGRSGKGIVIGCYHLDDARGIFARLTPAQREQLALEQGAKIHPQYPIEFENSFSVEWGRIRHNEGAWMMWDDPADFDVMQQTLTQPDGPFFFAGDWLSPLNSWQAGAFTSAHRACRQVHARAIAG